MSQTKSNKSQTQTTTITLTLPSTASGMKRSGEGTLLIQRGDLGHLQQIRYGSFQELGLIIQKAEATLIGLEIEPPQLPTPPTDTPSGEDDTPAEIEVEDTPEEVLVDDEPNETQSESEIETDTAAPPSSLKPEEEQADIPITKTSTPASSKPALPPRQPKPSSNTTANSQLTLF